jgi:hypothetical protein
MNSAGHHHLTMAVEVQGVIKISLGQAVELLIQILKKPATS